MTFHRKVAGVGVWGGGWGLVQDGHTALLCASHSGHIKVVLELIGKGADVNKVDKVNISLCNIYTGG